MNTSTAVRLEDTLPEVTERRRPIHVILPSTSDELSSYSQHHKWLTVCWIGAALVIGIQAYTQGVLTNAPLVLHASRGAVFYYRWSGYHRVSP